MAPKTYPQQIADLKAERQQLTDEVEKLRGQITHIDSLNEEIERLQGALADSSKIDSQDFVGLQAKLNDANQKADEQAARNRRLTDENSRLAHVNGGLHNGLEKLEHLRETLETKDRTIADLEEKYKVLTQNALNRQRGLAEQAAEITAQLEAQSGQLRELRLAKQRDDRILNEVRSALKNAPDVISSLKYIVGI
jgi:chromosome segregation ATPase